MLKLGFVHHFKITLTQNIFPVLECCGSSRLLVCYTTSILSVPWFIMVMYSRCACSSVSFMSGFTLGPGGSVSGQCNCISSKVCRRGVQLIQSQVQLMHFNKLLNRWFGLLCAGVCVCKCERAAIFCKHMHGCVFVRVSEWGWELERRDMPCTTFQWSGYAITNTGRA